AWLMEGNSLEIVAVRHRSTAPHLCHNRIWGSLHTPIECASGHRMYPFAQTKKERLGLLRSKKPKYPSAHRNAPSPFWCLAVWHENYYLLLVQVFSADPI